MTHTPTHTRICTHSGSIIVKNGIEFHFTSHNGESADRRTTNIILIIIIILKVMSSKQRSGSRKEKKSRADTGVCVCVSPAGREGHRAGSFASILRDNRQRVIDRGQLGRGT